MAKIQATMSTEIALDMLQASDSIKRITQLVNHATNAWKAQESQLRATGDYLGAAQAKYDGLGNAIQQQQAKIEKLRKEQSELKGNTVETAEQYLKYQQQIDQATAKLASIDRLTIDEICERKNWTTRKTYYVWLRRAEAFLED